MAKEDTGAEAIAGAVAGSRTGADAETGEAGAGADIEEDAGVKAEAVPVVTLKIHA